MKQEEILVKLVQGKDGKQWASNVYGWSLDGLVVSACDWTGVDCEWGNGAVTSITLPGTNLMASIPSEFGMLSNLKELDLSDNIIFGLIPEELSRLPKLEALRMPNNQLSGPLPSFVSSSLQVLDFENNRLSGKLPSDFGEGLASMTNFNVCHNQLSGIVPKSITDMRKLQYLQLSNNLFYGTLPAGLGSLPNLQFLYIDNNNIMGEIPKELTPPGTKLAEVWLQDNLFSGTILANFAEVSTLTELYVDGNKLTGTLPDDLCTEQINADFYDYNPSFYETNGRNTRDFCESIACPKDYYSIEGIWPCEPCPSGYRNPYLGRELSCIPKDQGSMLSKFYSDTDGGNWVGGSNWYRAGVGVCDFHGITCNDVGQVTAIELSGMGLKGTIPEVLGFLEHLDVLDLSDNELDGFIPSDLIFAPLSSLNLSGNRLKGVVPPKLCMKDVNGNGDGRIYECDKVLCAEGTYSSTGMANDNGKCLPCNDGVAFLGKKSCGSGSKSGSSGLASFFGSANISSQGPASGSSSDAIVILVVVFIALGLVGVVVMHLRRHRRERVQTEETEELALEENASVTFTRTVI